MSELIYAKKIYIYHDYPMLSDWWVGRGSPVQQKELFPPTGFIMWSESEPLCAGFLFKTDAKIAVIGHVVSNPFTKNKETRSLAVDALIDKLILEAKECGFKAISCSSNVDRLNKRYEAHGFTKSDENEVHYGRIL